MEHRRFGIVFPADMCNGKAFSYNPDTVYKTRFLNYEQCSNVPLHDVFLPHTLYSVCKSKVKYSFYTLWWFVGSGGIDSSLH
jgi:hypothetical protein